MKSYRLYFLIIIFIVTISINIAWTADAPSKPDNVKNYSSNLPQNTVRPVIKIDRGSCCMDGDIIVTNETQPPKIAPTLAFKKKPGNIPLSPMPNDREFRDSGHPDLLLTLSIELPEQDGSWIIPTATINVTNIGNQATSAETTVDLHLYDHPNLYYNRKLIQFWSKMVPILGPNMTHSISETFNISKTWTPPGTQTSHTILPGTFRLISRLNTELLAPDEEAGDGANVDEIIFEYSGQTGFYDLKMLGAKLTGDNRLKLSLKNLGASISEQKYAQMYVAVSVDGGAFKRLNLPTVDPQGSLRFKAGPSDFFLPPFNFIWPLPAEAGDDGLATFVSGARHQITARVGLHGYNNNVHFSYDSHPGNNERVSYVGGTPDLVVCFKKINLSKTASYSYYPPRIKNIGNAPSGPANLRFWIEDKGVENYTVPSLPAGGEHSIQRKVWWFQKGVRRFTLMVDNNTEVEEGEGESNNTIAGLICVSALGIHSYDRQGCVPSETLCSDAPGMAEP